MVYWIQTIPETDIFTEHNRNAIKYMIPFFLFQYFVFDFHMPPVMLFDKIITLSVSMPLILFDFIYCYLSVLMHEKNCLYLECVPCQIYNRNENSELITGKP